MAEEAKTAQQDARDLLEQVWGSHLPVDPARVARAIGLQVIEADLDSQVSGALTREVGKDPVITLARGDSDVRQRFSCAHEIGHYVKRTNSPYRNDEYGYVDYRDMLSAQGTNPDEIYANAFAAELLMPELEVRRLNKLGRSPMQMSVHFGVSTDAMRFRLSNLRLLR